MFDSYTNELCRPIVSQEDIDVMVSSGQSITSVLSPLVEDLLQSKLKPMLDAAEATHKQNMERLDRWVPIECADQVTDQLCYESRKRDTSPLCNLLVEHSKRATS